MSRGVDVLAVMESQIRGTEQDGKTRAVQMREARAAVAELIEAVEGGRNETFGRFVFDEHEANKLRAALARVRGAA